MSNVSQDKPAPDQANQPVSASKRKLLSTAVKSAPYALTLASGSSLANTSAFQCIQNNRDLMFTSELSREHAVVEHIEDHWMRRYIEEYSVTLLHETLVDDPDNPDEMIWVTQESTTYTVYIPAENTTIQQNWYTLTDNRLVPFTQQLPTALPNEQGETVDRYSWVGPVTTNARAKGIIFFEPNGDDTGLTGISRYHPFRDFEDIDQSAYTNAPGTPTVLTKTCLCSVDPENYGSICL